MRLTTMHPTYALFLQPYEAGTLACDIQRLGRMVRGELEPLPAKPNINPDHHALAEMVKYCAATGEPLAYDIETAPCAPGMPWTGKQPTRAALKSIAFGTTRHSLAIWWEDAQHDEGLVAMIKAVLCDPALKKVGQNVVYFDNPVLKRYGFDVVNFDDTRDRRRALSATSRLSLRYLASIYTDFWNWKDSDNDSEKTVDLSDTDNDEQEDEEDEAPATHSWQSRSREELLEYNGYDTNTTARTDRGLRRDWPQAGSNNGNRVQGLYELHRGLAELSAEMHSNGIWVRQDWRRFMISALRQELREQEATLVTLADRRAFKPTPHAMRSLIFRSHKTPTLHRFDVEDPYDKKAFTKTGLCAVNERALLLLMVSGACVPELTTIIEAWWGYQGTKKRLGYLCSDMLDQATGPDGRLRAGFNSCGTDTGRFSCSEPNLLNVEKVLRSMYGPPAGHVMIRADKSQLELRVMECVAADDFLGEAIKSGDVYSTAARVWFDLPAELTTKQIKEQFGGLRQTNKIIQLARQYGAGEKVVFQAALKESRKFTLSKVQTLVKTWDRTNFRTKAYWTEELGRVMNQGFSESRILQRRRTYPQPPELSEVANYPVQSTAADLMNIEILELRRRLHAEVPSAKIVCFLYDAVYVEVEDKHEVRVKTIISDVMNRSWTIDGRDRPFPVEFKVARFPETWMEAG